LTSETETTGNDPRVVARERYISWLKGGAPGRLHLAEPDGQKICCSVTNGRGLLRLKTAWRRFWLAVGMYVTFSSWKVFFFRLSGVAIGKDVYIAHGVKLDWQAPWLITLEDGCTIGYEAVIAVHLYYRDKLILRRVNIGRGAVVGLRAIVAASMGQNSLLSPGSVLLADAPDGATMGGVPAKVLDWAGEPS
jgi:hypothetical protein